MSVKVIKATVTVVLVWMIAWVANIMAFGTTTYQYQVLKDDIPLVNGLQITTGWNQERELQVLKEKMAKTYPDSEFIVINQMGKTGLPALF